MHSLHSVLEEEVVIHNLAETAIEEEEEKGVETKWGEQGNWRVEESVQEMNPVLACG